MANKDAVADTIQFDEAKAKLAQGLRQLRRAARLTGTEAARQAGISQSKISKIETTVLTPNRDDVESLCVIYKAPARAKKELMGSLEVIETEFSDWRMYLRNAKQPQTDHKEYESKATSIRLFQPTLVPGLLQTSEYIRAMLEGRGHSANEIVAIQAGRIERQGVLYDQAKSFVYVVTEAVLRSPFGNASVMIGQMDRLFSLSDLPNIDIRILPLMQQMPAVALTQFCMFDNEFVTAETFTGEMLVRDRRDVTMYGEIFEEFANVSVAGSAVRSMLQRIGDDYRVMPGKAEATPA